MFTAKTGFNLLEARRRAIQGYLKSIIESVVSQATSNIIEKTSLYRFLRIPPIDLLTFGEKDDPRLGGSIASRKTLTQEQAKVPIFVKDPELSFERVMSYGYDFQVV